MRPLLVNIFLTDLFFIIKNIDIASYVDDNTPYIAADNIDDLVKSLEEVSTTLFPWFDNNLLKNNPGVCHLLISSNENITVKIGEYEIENSEYEKLFGFKLDRKLNFDEPISDICKKARRKLNALVRITPFTELRRILMNAFFNSQFSYCLLNWICHSRTNNRKISRFHDRCSRFIYSDKQS